MKIFALDFFHPTEKERRLENTPFQNKTFLELCKKSADNLFFDWHEYNRYVDRIFFCDMKIIP